MTDWSSNCPTAKNAHRNSGNRNDPPGKPAAFVKRQSSHERRRIPFGASASLTCGWRPWRRMSPSKRRKTRRSNPGRDPTSDDSLDHNSGTTARRASAEMLQVQPPSSIALRASMLSLLATAGIMIKLPTTTPSSCFEPRGSPTRVFEDVRHRRTRGSRSKLERRSLQETARMFGAGVDVKLPGGLA